jgi:hypothetical protein
MKTKGDFIDLIIDKYRNTKAADIAMYIGSLVISLFRGKQ